MTVLAAIFGTLLVIQAIVSIIKVFLDPPKGK